MSEDGSPGGGDSTDGEDYLDTVVEVRTWQEGGEYRRERVQRLDADGFARARDRIDGEGGLEWGVGALVEHEGRILLVRESGLWLLPGGEVEPGESHAEALVREIEEETGVEIAPGERLAVVRNVLRHDGEERSFRFAIHRATAETTTLADDPGLADEDIDAVRWAEGLPGETLDRDLLTELLGDGWG